MIMKSVRGLLFAGTALILPAAAMAQASDTPAQIGNAPAEDFASPAEQPLPSTPGTGPGATAASDGASADPAEIVVTAQNRAQNVQDVPIAIDVVNAETLKDSGVNDFISLQRVAPVVNITSDTVNTRVSVRGIGTNSNDETQDQSIAVNIDGEYINRPTVLNTSLFDIERVEVLRGPQGTLYGRNATGGAINFITRKPGRDFGVDASAIIGNYDQVTVEGGVDIPFGELGGLRLAGIYNDLDGYNFHPNVGLRSGGSRTVGGRASLRLRPVAGLTVDLVAERVEVDAVPAAQAFVNFNAGTNGPGPNCLLNGFTEVGPLTPGTQCIPSNTNFLRQVNRRRYDAPTTGVGESHRNSSAFRGRVAYDFGPATLTYIGGYRDTDAEPGRTPLSPNYVTTSWGSEVATHSHELRLNGDINGIIWQTGVFTFRERQVNEGAGLFNPTLFGGSYINYFRRPFVKTKSWAGFGQADVPLTETITAVVGARYTTDERSGRFENLGFQRGVGAMRVDTPATAAQTLNLENEGNKFTWLAGLNYQPNRDTLFYAKVATGFKAGGFDAVDEYDPETNTAYEAGAKLNFGGGSRSLINVAGFYYDYKDLQVGVLLDPLIGAQVFNAGKATIWGLEAETQLALGDNGTFHASINYLNAKYDKLSASYAIFCAANCGTLPGNLQTGITDLNPDPNIFDPVDLSGNTPPQSPRWVITAGYDHVFDLGIGELTASVFTRFRSSYFTDIFNYNDSRQKATTQTDLSLKFKPEGGRFSVQAFVRNIENKRPLSFASFTAAGPDDVFNWQFGPPRTYGVRLGVNF